MPRIDERDNQNKLTFGDLEVGDKFISFPLPGDDSGHGGYLGGAWVFLKTQPTQEEGVIPLTKNAVDLHSGKSSHFREENFVYKVYL